MLGIIIYVNYSYINNDAPKYTWLQKFGLSYFLYLVPFALAYLMQFIFYPSLVYFKNKWFGFLILSAPAFFAFRVNFYSFQHYILQHFLADKNIYWLAITNLFTKALLIMIPVAIIWWLKDRKEQNLYGFYKTINTKPYLIMVLLMLPLIAVASNNSEFLKQYPAAMNAVGDSLIFKKLDILLFELCYAFDFLSIEFFFRGFLILAFIRLAGKHAIVPAACFYCCIHLGKPMPEAISSFFGALLLGIISYNTKSIWGGLIIHIGIAGFMELLAYMQH